MTKTIRFAVFGDVHGHQIEMYQRARAYESQTGKTLDVILQVGDFETIRTKEDFEFYFAPQKYHHLSDISEYMDGTRNAEWLTIFTGGNHEAWGVLEKVNNGGFLCPNIYYLGRSGSLEVKGVRISGLTGLYNKEHYDTSLKKKGYDWKFYRKSDVEKLKSEHPDILLLHEWPLPIDTSFKIEKEVNVENWVKTQMPNPAYDLVNKLKPQYVFAGHLHKPHIVAKKGKTTFIGLQDASEEFGMQVIEIPK